MKELSIEQKAKRYDEAIEKLRSLHNDYDTVSTLIDVKEELENIFPELKESEDERIRKKLYESIRINNSREVADKYIAWLEKQGEQKPTDKVEPKFKVGDWVVYCGKTRKITGLHNGIFTITNQDGSYFFNQVESTTEPVFHFWTIQDAKDGDVLCCESSDIEYIIMSKGVNKHGNIDSYFRYNSLDGFGVDIPSVFSIRHDDITPATKEQRDLLFQKMKEEGYEWNAEKKELKKIEQKPAWSEEDEMFVHGLIRGLSAKKDIHGHTTFSSDCIDITETINWLKSIKDRVQPQNRWKPSELQLECLSDAIEHYHTLKYPATKLVELLEQLKKLREE